MRAIEELAGSVYKFWPENITELEKNISIIPRLLDTQEKFLSILKLSDAQPFAWKDVLKTTTLEASLFLKHLLVLSDIGGERLKRIKTEIKNIFGNGKMLFKWEGKEYEYKLQTYHEKKNWDNGTLKIDGIGLSKREEISPMIEDVINLILYGGLTLQKSLPNEIEEKCIIGDLIGKEKELEKFVKQRYIWVSRITGGATANSLGNLAQNYAVDYLKKRLKGWDFSNKRIPGISQNDNRTLTAFDIVAKSPDKKYCAIEVSFQVTTNSVIERKAGQAKARLDILHSKKHKIAYIIDGAGNFERESALKTICQYSDCIVTFTDNELDKLIEYLKGL